MLGFGCAIAFLGLCGLWDVRSRLLVYVGYGMAIVFIGLCGLWDAIAFIGLCGLWDGDRVWFWFWMCDRVFKYSG